MTPSLWPVIAVNPGRNEASIRRHRQSDAIDPTRKNDLVHLGSAAPNLVKLKIAHGVFPLCDALPVLVLALV
jgi:hypothetical protein